MSNALHIQQGHNALHIQQGHNALHIQQGHLCWTLKNIMYNNKNKDINFSTHNVFLK